MNRLTPKMTKQKKKAAALAAKTRKTKPQFEDNEADNSDDELNQDGNEDIAMNIDEDEAEKVVISPKKKTAKTLIKFKKLAKAAGFVKKGKLTLKRKRITEDDAERTATKGSTKKAKKNLQPKVDDEDDDDDDVVKDERMEAQNERIAKTERELIAFGLNPLRLFVQGFHRKTTTAELLKEEFPKCAEVEYELNKTFAYITFSKAADAEKAFVDSADKTINGRTVVVTYAPAEKGAKPAKLSKDLIEEHFNRSCGIERSRLTTCGLHKLQLIVKWLPKDTSEFQLSAAFPKSIKTNINKPACEGWVVFDNEANCKKAFESSGDLVINEKKVAVLYAKNQSETPRLPKSAKNADIFQLKEKIKKLKDKKITETLALDEKIKKLKHTKNRLSKSQKRRKN